MNDTSPSLELSEVAARFSESERLLLEARERLHGILQSEERSQHAADSLSESARTVASFTERADKLLEEAGIAVSVAREVLESGRDLLSGNTLDVVEQRVSDALEKIEVLRATEAETFAALKEDSNARQLSQAAHERALVELQGKASEIDQRVASALEKIEKLQATESETLMALQENSKAQQLSKAAHERALAQLQAKASAVDERVAATKEEVEKLQTAETETLAAVNAEAQARQLAQEEHDRALADLEAKILEGVRAIRLNRAALWLALGLSLVGHVLVAVLVMVT